MTDAPAVTSQRTGRKGARAKAAAAPRPAPQPSRGRPADPASMELADEGEGVERLTRRSRRDGGAGDFEIPAHLKKPGWDYEFKTITIMGQPVDPADMQRVYEGGWRPVPARDMAELCPPGWEKPTIERYGQMLFTRPMRLTQEAKREDFEMAEKQKTDKLQSAMASGADDNPRLVKRHVTEFSIEGEVGTHREKSAAA